MVVDLDRALIERCQTIGTEDFEAAFSELYQRHKDVVFSIAYRVTGDPNEALDAAQDAFLLLYQNVKTFNFESKFTTWLYRLVVNASIDHLRKGKSRKKSGQLSLDPESQEALAVRDNRTAEPLESAKLDERQDRVHAAIQQLSPKLRVVTVLRYLQNLSYEDLAETLGISLGTVKSRLARAHLALAELLADEAQGADLS